MARQKVTTTVVELLVVILIIGTVIALLLPAVQSAREAARRSGRGREPLVEALVDGSASAGDAEPGEPSLPTQRALERKIVYAADIDLLVEDFQPMPDKVETLAKQFDAYVASSDVTGSPGFPRRGEWKIRVPVEHFEAFLAAARELGEIQSVSVDSQDVTEEYYDVEARIRNKETERARLGELMKDATGDLEHILAIEREVSRVQGELERVEGRLEVLKNLTALTTVNLTVREIKDYVPEEAASYTTRVRRGFEASIAALVSTAQALSIAVIVLLPWLAVLLLVGIPPLLVWRMVRRHRAG